MGLSFLLGVAFPGHSTRENLPFSRVSFEHPTSVSAFAHRPDDLFLSEIGSPRFSGDRCLETRNRLILRATTTLDLFQPEIGRQNLPVTPENGITFAGTRPPAPVGFRYASSSESSPASL